MDATRLWAVLHKYRRPLSLLLPALLLFAAGWQTGRVMSPYYTAQPIIFQSGESGSAAASQELRELQAAGRPDQGSGGEVAGTAVPASPNESGQAVTSAAPVNSSEPSPTAAVQPKQFVGSLNSDLYHHPSCAAASRIKPENQIWFSSIEEAEAAGYKPSKCTQEKL